jgi:hypothetical protein
MSVNNLGDREYQKFEVTADDEVFVKTTGGLNGVMDETNSTHEPLLAGATFTGEPFNILPYSIIYVTVYSDKASATDGLVIEQGHKVGASYHWTGKTFSIQPALEYMRISYTNGGDDQTAFRLHVIPKQSMGLDSSHRIQDPIIDDDDARLVKSVLTAKADGDGFVNIEATASNNLKVTDAESGLAIAKGDVTGTTFVHKFGNAPDFDTADGGTTGVTVWDGADDGSYDQMIYQYSSTADIDSLVSSSAADTQDIEIQGLDTNYDLVTQTITLTGQTRAALTTDLIRVFRMKNVGTTDIAGNVACYVDSTISSGVVSDSTKVRAVIIDGNNQTEMAVYTIPNGKTGYVRSWFASSSGGKLTTNYIMRLKARPFGQVFQLKHRTSIADGAPIQHLYIEPEVFSAKTDIEMTAKISETGVTAAGVSAGFDIVLVDN